MTEEQWQLAWYMYCIDEQMKLFCLRWNQRYESKGRT